MVLVEHDSSCGLYVLRIKKKRLSFENRTNHGIIYNIWHNIKYLKM